MLPLQPQRSARGAHHGTRWHASPRGAPQPLTPLSVPAAGLLHFELPSIHMGGLEAALRRDPLDAAQRVQLKGPAEEEEDSESTAL